MKIVIHASPHIEWQGRYAKHAMSGLRQHGHDVSIVAGGQPTHCDVEIIMGPNMYQNIERAKTPYLMFNRKFVGNAPNVVHSNCAISWNGFNGEGIFCVDEVDPSRLERYMVPEEIEDWKTNGDKMIIIEQTNTGRSASYKKLDKFYTQAKKDYSGPSVMRRKPQGEENIQPEKVRSGLIKAKLIANLNSMISIEALPAGIPVISYDQGDPAYAITGRDPNNIHYPENRLEYFQHLAHCQWTEQEIQSGQFWEQLFPIRGPKLHEWTDGS